MGEKWLFGMLEKGVFRRQVAAVTKCTTTDIRAASEDHLIGDASLVGNLRNSRSLQNFVNHSPGISLKHYQVTDSSQLSRRRVCNEKTASIHFYSLKMYLGFLVKHGHLAAEEEVDPISALQDQDLMTAFFKHLETAETIRKTQLSPGSVGLFARSLVVGCQLLLPGPER